MAPKSPRKRASKGGKAKKTTSVEDIIPLPSSSGDAPNIKASGQSRTSGGGLSGPAKVGPSSTKGSEGPAKMGSGLDSASRGSCMKQAFGFGLSDVSSWRGMVKFLNSPRDPASMAAWRILFGLLMMVDIPQERGMAYADYRWGDPDECRFPLFDFLKPLPVDWMYLIYLIMFTGAFGIFLGAFYRMSCVLFCVPYWYIFLLDKTAWNNHSYLYGLISLQMLFMDANRIWSIDAWMRSRIRNSHIPLWNVALIRFQIMLVYFYAGLKKLDGDWVGGYSMESLSLHWVFDPFRLFLTDDQIDYFIVHLGGLFLDLSAGFLLFFDATRIPAALFTSAFHIMNSQLFSIGMFPYAMLASTTVFFSPSWPRYLCPKLLFCCKDKIPSLADHPQPSDHCIYPPSKDGPKSRDASNKQGKNSSASLRHHLTALGFILYMCPQLFLPYSHFITKGYNNWTNGLYGYSWDMMVHSWDTQHIKIKYINGKTGEEGYLAPDYWSDNTRWASHSDMMKQYATCIGGHLELMGTQEPQLYFDVWKSMNGRFQQRMFNPTVDLLKAPWSPFEMTPWLMPLLTDLSDWRTKLREIGDQLDQELDVTFVADFPGMYLENFISEDLGNTTIQVLSGKVLVELVDSERNISLEIGDRIQLPAGEFHNIHTVSAEPSCYMYVFVNTTEQAIAKEATDFINTHLDWLKEDDTTEPTKDIDESVFEGRNISSAAKQRVVERVHRRRKYEQIDSMTVVDKVQLILTKKWSLIHRSVGKTMTALGHLVLGRDSVLPGLQRNSPRDRTTSQDRSEL